MQKSVSKLILDKWLAKLRESDVDKFTVDCLEGLSDNNALDDVKKLKGVIAEIEDNYAKDKNFVS